VSEHGAPKHSTGAQRVRGPLGDHFEIAGRAGPVELQRAAPISAEVREELLVIKDEALFLCGRTDGDVAPAQLTGEGSSATLATSRRSVWKSAVSVRLRCRTRRLTAGPVAQMNAFFIVPAHQERADGRVFHSSATREADRRARPTRGAAATAAMSRLGAHIRTGRRNRCLD
jgi:hypothetical protein